MSDDDVAGDGDFEKLETIIEHFQPIENLFSVMGAADSGVQGIFVRQWAEIGMYLSTNFKKQVEQLFC
ncbi:hypothetical protein [Solidesulfovibrio sp. C21]|uniref:hypothetical protein n=1 Tax=Solidesulfovibrio sp. C21 TaxID=3398613 RepID=UPI0039FC09BF